MTPIFDNFMLYSTNVAQFASMTLVLFFLDKVTRDVFAQYPMRMRKRA